MVLLLHRYFDYNNKESEGIYMKSIWCCWQLLYLCIYIYFDWFYLQTVSIQVDGCCLLDNFPHSLPTPSIHVPQAEAPICQVLPVHNRHGGGRVLKPGCRGWRDQVYLSWCWFWNCLQPLPFIFSILCLLLPSCLFNLQLWHHHQDD